MSKPRKLTLSLFLLVLFVCAVVFSFAAARRKWTSNSSASALAPQMTPQTSNRRSDYVHRARVPQRLTWNLNKLGNRLEVPGKERISIVGSLLVGNERQAIPASVLGEFPDRLRLILPGEGRDRTIIFNRNETRSASALSDLEKKVLETLVYDTAEHFFAAQMQSQATRFVGSRFRLDDGSAANYSGPYYDVYQVADQIRITNEVRLQPKFYYFNSDTLLLERVMYELNRDGVTTRVELLLSDWRARDGQQVAHRMERLENGLTVFVFTVNSMALGARSDDGAFDAAAIN